MLKMLMFFWEFRGGAPRGNPQENFNIFNISPVSSTFFQKSARNRGNVKDVKVRKSKTLTFPGKC